MEGVRKFFEINNTIQMGRVEPDVGKGPPPRPVPDLQSSTLYSLLTEYVLFTHGIFACAYGRPDTDILSMLCNELGLGEDTIFAILFEERPIFEGFAQHAPQFGHTLYACEVKHWNRFLNEMTKLCGFKRKPPYVARCLAHNLLILDHLEYRNQGTHSVPTPNIPVVAFGATTTDGVLRLVADSDPLKMPSVVKLPPDPAHVKLAGKILGEDLDRILDGHRVPDMSGDPSDEISNPGEVSGGVEDPPGPSGSG